MQVGRVGGLARRQESHVIISAGVKLRGLDSAAVSRFTNSELSNSVKSRIDGDYTMQALNTLPIF
jgi:hypothetical protein